MRIPRGQGAGSLLGTAKSWKEELCVPRLLSCAVLSSALPSHVHPYTLVLPLIPTS